MNRPNLYRPIHKGLRSLMFETTALVARTDFADSAENDRAAGAVGLLLELLDEHAALEPGDHERVFEPFGSRLARGAGLSLAALRRVLQQQGGEVTAVAAVPPGRGVFFRLDFARAA